MASDTPGHQVRMEGPVNENTINPGIIQANYAVRGKLAKLADKIRKELQSGSLAYPFSNITYANLGNPQGCGQKPITYCRQVLSLMEYPELLKAPATVLKDLFHAGCYGEG